MTWQDLGIEWKCIAETRAAAIRLTLENRQDLPAVLEELAGRIPAGERTRPPFCIIRFVTSTTEGLDAEIGFPVRRVFATEMIQTRTFPSLEVLSLTHIGPVQTLGESYGALYSAASERGLISDEFVREVDPDWEGAEWNRVEVQFVLRNWRRLFAANLDRVLGEEAEQRVMQGLAESNVTSTLDERFGWVKTMLGRLDGLANEDQTYDILSRCAHVFPKEQIGKLRGVYEDALARTDDTLGAVDAVIAFMDEDPGWRRPPHREGNVVYATKAPRDTEAYENAQSEAEQRSASCYCPILRDRLEHGMPASFCYCGAGWFRQQWEGAIGRPVSISIERSVLRGDDACQFAIQLPDDLGTGESE